MSWCYIQLMRKSIVELNEREFALARVELLEAWKRLDVARETFLSAVKADANLPAWCEGKAHARAARSAAIAAFSDFFYAGEESAKAVHRLIGLIGVSAATARLARKLNDEKRAFADCMNRLQNCWGLDERQERHPLVRSAFQQIKIARINTLQAIRQVVVVTPGLQRISWCISHKTRIKQVTREQAIEYIRSTPARRARLSNALSKLERLAPKTLLARYRPGDKLAIANATYLNQWDKPENRQYTSGMPLLIELKPNEALPPCNPPRREKTARKARPGNIESTDFVKALKLRRYHQEPIRKREVDSTKSLSQLFRGP